MIEVKNNVVNAQGRVSDLLTDFSCLTNALYVSGISRTCLVAAFYCAFDDSIACEKIVDERYPVDK
ncbi:MAG: hypothetical protein J6C06_08070 [Lachnospiraceae bacterium]|nr:hypothetical protein [Lachnospiraceae bacterium]